MNVSEESPSTTTAHWLPSHVRITGKLLAS